MRSSWSHPSYKPYLDIPGGYVEPGESPSQAAVREVKEELGINVELGRLLVVDWWTEGVEQSDGAKVLFVFDGGVLEESSRQSIEVDGVEILGCDFVELMDLERLTIARLAVRLREASRARLGNTPVYMENGASFMRE